MKPREIAVKHSFFKDGAWREYYLFPATADSYDAKHETMWNRVLRDYDSGMSMSRAVANALKSIGITKPTRQTERNQTMKPKIPVGFRRPLRKQIKVAVDSLRLAAKELAR